MISADFHKFAAVLAIVTLRPKASVIRRLLRHLTQCIHSPALKLWALSGVITGLSSALFWHPINITYLPLCKHHGFDQENLYIFGGRGNKK